LTLIVSHMMISCFLINVPEVAASLLTIGVVGFVSVVLEDLVVGLAAGALYAHFENVGAFGEN